MELFYIGMPVVWTDGRSVARAVYGHVFTKFSRIGYGAPHVRASRARLAPLISLASTKCQTARAMR